MNFSSSGRKLKLKFETSQNSELTRCYCIHVDSITKKQNKVSTALLES
jgi:hypothetical protein